MEVEIEELSKNEAGKLSQAIIDFNPVKCYGCGNRKGIVQRFFLLNMPASEKNHKKIKKELINKFGLTYYGFDEETDRVITTGKCPICDNEKMAWEY